MVMIMKIDKAKIALLLSLFVFTLVFAVTSAAVTLRKEVKQKIPVKGETKLHVKNPRGKTIVIGKEGLEEISIEAIKIVKTKREEAAQELMQALTFEVEIKGDEVWIITRHPDSKKEQKSIWSIFKGLKHRTAIDFTIEVPRSFGVEVITTSGDVEVSSLEGDASLRATSGDVRVREIGGSSTLQLTSGDVDVRQVSKTVQIQLSSGSAFVDGAGGGLVLAATSGDVKAFNIGGNADLKLVSGDCIIKGCQGDLTTVSSSGDMVIKDVEGSVEVSSSSGNIEIFVLPVGEKKYSLSTCSGDVDLFYKTAKDFGFLLDVNTMSGSIEGDMDIKLDKISRRRLKGVVGSGRAKIIIATASGDVSIYQRGNNR